MFLRMTTQRFTAVLLATVAIAFSGGVIFGGGFASYEANSVIKAEEERYQSLKKNFDDILQLNTNLREALRAELATHGGVVTQWGGGAGSDEGMHGLPAVTQ